MSVIHHLLPPSRRLPEVVDRPLPLQALNMAVSPPLMYGPGRLVKSQVVAQIVLCRGSLGVLRVLEVDHDAPRR